MIFAAKEVKTQLLSADIALQNNVTSPQYYARQPPRTHDVRSLLPGVKDELQLQTKYSI